MTTDLELAREWLNAYALTGAADSLAALLSRVRAEGREQGLEEAALHFDGYENPTLTDRRHATHIRALKGKKP